MNSGEALPMISGGTSWYFVGYRVWTWYIQTITNMNRSVLVLKVIAQQSSLHACPFHKLLFPRPLVWSDIWYMHVSVNFELEIRRDIILCETYLKAYTETSSASSSAQKRSRLNEAAKTACDLLDKKKLLINVHDTHPSLCISSISNFHAQTFLEIFCTMFSPPAGWPFCWGLYMSMAPPITEMSEKASDQIFLKLSASFWILTLPWRLWAFARKGF